MLLLSCLGHGKYLTRLHLLVGVHSLSDASARARQATSALFAKFICNVSPLVCYLPEEAITEPRLAKTRPDIPAKGTKHMGRLEGVRGALIVLPIRPFRGGVVEVVLVDSYGR